MDVEQVADFRLDDERIQQDPFASYHALRDGCPVLTTDLGGKPAFVLSRHADISSAMMDTATFSSHTTPQPTLLHSDPPEQQQLRAMVSGLFSRSAVASIEPFIAQRSADLLDALVASGGCDIVDDFAGPLTVSVSSRLFGISVADVEQLRHWTRVSAEYVRSLRLGTPAREEAKEAHSQLRSFATSLIAPGAHQPGGVIARLAELTRAGELTEEQCSHYIVLLLVAGHSTTTNLVANSTYTLIQHPELLARLRHEPAFAARFLEEVLRTRGSFQRVPRVTTRDAEVAGTTIPEGSAVYLLIGSGNRDSDVYADADEFEPDSHRAMHLSFGHGIHTCLGQWLARLEVRIALQLLAARVERIELESGGTEHLAGGTFNEFGFHHLAVRFTPEQTSDTGSAAEHTAVRAIHQQTTDLTLVTKEFETDVCVSAKDAVSDGVVAVTLERVGGEAFPHWEPGAHVDLVLNGAPTRQYSLCGSPADRSQLRIGVLRDPLGRGSSLYVHDTLQAGDVARIRGPRNNFPLVSADRYLFIGGGIGITPLLPMIDQVDRAGSDWRLVYGGRERASMAFLSELARYGDRVSVRPQDETGLLDLDALLGEPEAGTLVYCCGPEPLLAAVEERCGAWPERTLHVERFSPRPISVTTNKPIEVVLERSGLTLAVPADRSVLDVVEEAGVFVLSSCGEGTCGTCETVVLAGAPEHRDSVLDQAARESNSCMMLCVSRARSPRLVLDL